MHRYGSQRAAEDDDDEGMKLRSKHGQNIERNSTYHLDLVELIWICPSVWAMKIFIGDKAVLI